MKLHITTLATLLAFAVIPLSAQNSAPKNRIKVNDGGLTTDADDSNVKAAGKSERQKVPGIPQISVIDKLLSIESALNTKLKRRSEEDWTKDYGALYQKFRRDGRLNAIRGEGKDGAAVAMALGIKASDAVVALKARNVEALNDAAGQIDILAKRLGASDAELGMANTVKVYANKKQWFNAFLALGRLQRDVTNYLESSGDKIKRDQAMLVIVGGWLQGGRCVTHVIDENYDEFVSNILREQRLVDIIIASLDTLDPKYVNDPLVADIRKALPEIRKRVDVGLKAPVKQEDVKWLHKTFDEFVVRITTKE